MSARVDHRPDGSIALTFSYRRWVVDQLKAHIPVSERTYEPNTKTWYVSPPWGSVAIGILERSFDHVHIERDGERRPEPSPIRANDQFYRDLHLLPSAPPAVVSAAYRALARLHHPDAGGDTSKMQTVNGAFEALRLRGAA